MSAEQELNEIRKALNLLSSMPETTRRIEGKVDSIDRVVRKVQIDNAAKHAEQDAWIEDMESDINGMGTKIRNHIEKHIAWMIGSVGIIGIILTAARFLFK